MSSQNLLRLLAWIALGVIVLSTLTPNELRPQSGLPVQWERLLAFAVVGFLLAIAYPRQLLVITVVVLGVAVLLEALQLLTPSRHGRVFDLAVKLAGGSAGMVAGWLMALWRTHQKRDHSARDEAS